MSHLKRKYKDKQEEEEKFSQRKISPLVPKDTYFPNGFQNQKEIALTTSQTSEVTSRGLVSRNPFPRDLQMAGVIRMATDLVDFSLRCLRRLCEGNQESKQQQ